MLTVTAAFTKTVGVPATGLTLAEIDFHLVAIAKATGAQTVVWDGTQHPTAEVAGLGVYLRQYADDDLALYDYVAGANYTGAEVLDSDWITGSASSVELSAAALADIDDILTAEHGAGLWTDSSGTGDIMFPYLVTDAGATPIIGAKVIVTTDLNGNNRVAMDYTDEFGYARFHLAAGSYYFWTYRAGYQVSRADVEVVA